MIKKSVKKTIVGTIIVVFVLTIPLLVGLGLDENIANTIYTYMFFGVVIIIVWAVWSTPVAKDSFDVSSFDIVYKYKKTSLPIGSMIFTAISLIWLLISTIQDSGAETAIAFFISFLALAVFEYMLNWYKGTKFNDFTFSYNNHGVTISKGSWNKEFIWNNYKRFTTAYRARFGQYLSYLPFTSLFLHDADRYTLLLYRQDEFKHDYELHGQTHTDSTKNITIEYDSIVVTPEYKDQIINYIKQYLPFERQKINPLKKVKSYILEDIKEEPDKAGLIMRLFIPMLIIATVLYILVMLYLK